MVQIDEHLRTTGRPSTVTPAAREDETVWGASQSGEYKGIGATQKVLDCTQADASARRMK
jgi:hypothetical protein